MGASADAGYAPLTLAGTPGQLWMWGYNNYGGLGTNNTTQYSSPVQVGNDTNWQQISCGRYSSFAIKSNGTLWSWGNNWNGQLGHGNTTTISSPLQVGSDTDWYQVTEGHTNQMWTMAIKTDSTLWAMGKNTNGQLGLGDTTNRSVPTQVGSDAVWGAVKQAGNSTIGLRRDGTIYGWGLNTTGSSGTGNTTQYSSPVQIGSADDWVEIGGGYNHGLAINSSGELFRWGQNVSTWPSGGDRTSPEQEGSLTNWGRHSTRTDHPIAHQVWMAMGFVKSDGTLWTWGYGSWGKLGHGNTTNYNVPTQVGGLSNWTKIEMGSLHGAALKQDGTIWTWGRGGVGALGHNNTSDRSSPVQVGGLTTWKWFSAGYGFSGGIKTP